MIRLRLGFRTAAVAVVTLLVALAAGNRVLSALDTPAIARGAGASVDLVPAADLSEDRPPPVLGITGPDRPLDSDAEIGNGRRVWFAQGRWWAVMAVAPSGATHIWGLSGPEGPWVDTGVQVDDRSFARQSVVWTGDRLVVSSSGPKDYRSHGLRISRFAWSEADQRWDLEPDFPVRVTPTGGPDPVIAVGADDRIWLARLAGDGIEVAHSDPTQLTYTPFEPMAGGVAASDVGNLALTLDAGGVHIVWRSISTDQLVVATGDGEQWTSRAHRVYGASGAKALRVVAGGAGSDGALLAVLETSLAPRTSNDEEPSVVLAVLTDRTALVSVVARASDRLRNPVPVMGPDGAVHVISVIDPAGGAGVWGVSDKVATGPDFAFGVGTGRLLARAPFTSLSTPMAPLQTDPSGGLVVAVTGPELQTWYSAQEGTTTGDGAVAADSTGATLIHDTFDQLPLGPGGVPSSWSTASGAVDGSVVADANGGRALELTNPAGGSSARTCRTIPAAPGRPVEIGIDVRADGAGTADAQILTLRGPEGTMASVRITRKAELGLAGPNGRIGLGALALGVPLRLRAVIDPGTSTAALHVERIDGQVLVERVDLPLLSAVGTGPDEVCFAPAPGDPAARLTVSDLQVTRR